MTQFLNNLFLWGSFAEFIWGYFTSLTNSLSNVCIPMSCFPRDNVQGGLWWIINNSVLITFANHYNTNDDKTKKKRRQSHTRMHICITAHIIIQSGMQHLVHGNIHIWKIHPYYTIYNTQLYRGFIPRCKQDGIHTGHCSKYSLAHFVHTQCYSDLPQG